MIRSMTGFGKSGGAIGSGMVNVEIRSLNSKSFELNLRLPFSLKEKELELRNEMMSIAGRGKMDLIVTMENDTLSRKGVFNAGVISAYLDELSEIAGLQDKERLLPVILQLPNSMNTDRNGMTDSEWKSLHTIILKAFQSLDDFRKKEGKAMEDDLNGRLSFIEKLLKEVEKEEPKRMKEIRSRIRNNIKEAISEQHLDKTRFEEEMIYFLEKIDISEEKVRLRSHIKFFAETMKQKEANGKKLGFILQEMGREINTIGSKASHASIQQLVVNMKDELEKMKEQVANVL